MNKQIQDLQDHFYQLVKDMNFDAPYGVLTSQGTSKNGRKYHSVIFGRARTLDASINIFGEKFIQIRTSRYGLQSQVFRSIKEAEEFITQL